MCHFDQGEKSGRERCRAISSSAIPDEPWRTNCFSIIVRVWRNIHVMFPLHRSLTEPVLNEVNGFEMTEGECTYTLEYLLLVNTYMCTLEM